MAKENDVVLLCFEDKPLIFARIETILPDAKPDWYHVKLLILQVPLYSVTWILRDIISRFSLCFFHHEEHKEIIKSINSNLRASSSPFLSASLFFLLAGAAPFSSVATLMLCQ